MMHPGRAPRPFRSFCLTVSALVLALPAAALDIAWPEEASRVSLQTGPTAGFAIATGAFDGSQVPVEQVEGDLAEEVWQIPGNLSDPALLLGMVRDQLTSQGYEIGFTCVDRACGGFDFRYALPIAEGPAMHVDLGNFHYLSAMRDTDDGAERVVLTISHGGRQGYVHLARITPLGAMPTEVTPSSRRVDGDGGEGLIAHMAETGYAVLDDVTFETGASALSGDGFDSLVTLAAFLAEDGARRIVLVGHTDAEGALDSNIALSRARAAAVREHLVSVLGADPAQIEAAGVGYLSPRAANTTPDGREANRRVEVVLIGN